MLEKILQATTHHQELGNALASFLLLIAVVGLRQLLVQWVRRSAIQSADLRRRWIVQIRNGCFLLVLMGLVFIWVTELLAIAFSIAAFIVALVLATKELILCLTGSFLKVSSRAFSVGDRIEVGTFRGDVIDQTLLVTRIMEVGPAPFSHLYTGKIIGLPNSLFLNTPIINYSLTANYALHTFSVPVKSEDDWRQAEADLLVSAQETCAPFIELARKELTHHVNLEELGVSTVEPRVTLALPEPGRINLTIRVPLPGDQIGRCEQEIIHRFLERRAERTATRGEQTTAPSPQ
jgi:hypothetical protein